jgi:nitroreductase
MMNVYEVAIERRSIRRFKDKPIPYEVLKKCIDAARLAPSGRNMQVCEFLVIDDPQLLPKIFANIGGSVKLPPEKGGPRPENTPKAYTLILINKSKEGDANRRSITLYDIGMAAENLILSAWAEGIGCCPVMFFQSADIKSALKIPDEYDIGLVIVMGYPDESPTAEAATDSVDSYVDENLQRHVPKRKLEDILHRNGF